jgi:hypothetical protein
VKGTCEHGNKPSGSIKLWETREKLYSSQFHKRAQLHGVSFIVFNDERLADSQEGLSFLDLVC